EAERSQHATIPEQIRALQSKQTVVQTSRQGLEDRKTRASKILGKREDIEAKILLSYQLMVEQGNCELGLQQLRTQVLDVQKDLDAATNRIIDGTALHKAYEKATRDLEQLIQAYQTESERLAEELGRDIQQGKLLTVVPCDSALQAKCRFTTTA